MTREQMIDEAVRSGAPDAIAYLSVSRIYGLEAAVLMLHPETLTSIRRAFHYLAARELVRTIRINHTTDELGERHATGSQ